jgi:hypothetical protein
MKINNSSLYKARLILPAIVFILFNCVLFSQIKLVPGVSLPINRSLYANEFRSDSIIAQYYDTKLRMQNKITLSPLSVYSINIKYDKGGLRGAFRGFVVGALLGGLVGLVDWQQNGSAPPPGSFHKPYTFNDFLAPVITLSSLSTIIGVGAGGKKRKMYKIEGDQEIYLQNLNEMKKLLNNQ